MSHQPSGSQPLNKSPGENSGSQSLNSKKKQDEREGHAPNEEGETEPKRIRSMSYHRDDGKSEELKEAEHFCEVLHHMSNYATHCFQRFDKHERDFQGMKPHLKALVPSMESRMQNIRRAVVNNQNFLRKVLEHQGTFMNPEMDYQAIGAKMHRLSDDKMSKVRSTIRQCVRDWSAEGKPERDQCYKPILDKLHELYAPEVRSTCRVLLPGSGLSRLTWEVANMGFFSQGNEFSYYMLLAAYYILNNMNETNIDTIHPFVHDMKNLVSDKHQLLSIQIPDINPASLPTGAQFSMVAGDFMEVFADSEPWDVVVTCFFIDTAHDILEYLELIASKLKVGGHWINFGPLLYHYSDMGPDEISIDLTWEQVRAALPALGFEMIEEKIDQISTYTSNPHSMLQQHYKCVFNTCVRKDMTVTNP